MWSPGGHSLFFWGFLRNSCWSTVVFEHDHSLLLGTGVQLVVFYTAIEAQVFFKMLLALVTSQLAVAGQLRREVYPQRIRLFLGSRKWRWFQGGGLGRWGRWKCICLILGSHGKTGGESLSLLLGVRLESLFFHLPCTVAFTVLFLVVVIDSHC